MIINSKKVEQTVDREQRATFTKELVVVRARERASEADEPAAASASDASVEPPRRPPSWLPGPMEEGVPLAMVRKRLWGREAETHAPVVLIHGYGQNRYAWHLPGRSLFNHLVCAGFDVFNLELRGHGRSRHLGAHPPKRVGAFVEEDLPAALEEVQRLSGGRRVFLVGHSLGGLVSYAAAAALPDRVAGVATIGSPYQFTRGSLTLSVVSHLMAAVDGKVDLGQGLLPLKPLSEAMRLLRFFIESPIFPLPIRGFAPGTMEPRILSQHMGLAMDQGSIAVLRTLFLSAAEARRGGHPMGELGEYADEFESLDVPLLVIAGTEDDLAPPASVHPAFLRSRSTDKTYRAFANGHIDLLVGKNATTTIWPLLVTWLAQRARRSALRDTRSDEPLSR